MIGSLIIHSAAALYLHSLQNLRTIRCKSLQRRIGSWVRQLPRAVWEVPMKLFLSMEIPKYQSARIDLLGPIAPQYSMTGPTQVFQHFLWIASAGAILEKWTVIRGTLRSQLRAEQVFNDNSSTGYKLEAAIVPGIIITRAFDEAMESTLPFGAVIHTASSYVRPNDFNN